ncbi:MAG: hypothetical protein AB7T49_07320 [Oligoflexales bacterium]
MGTSIKLNSVLTIVLMMSLGSCQKKETKDFNRKAPASGTPTINTPGQNTGDQTTNTTTTTTDGGLDKDGIKRIYASTGKEVKLEYGARHENGDRYNVNHKFTNYEVTGYYLVANTEKIEMKTDGPNHGGCEDLPKCMWIEPKFEIKGGKADLGAEYPHPENHDDVGCKTCKSLGKDFSGKWIGYKVIAYKGADGYRVYEQWIDPDGLVNDKPANNWVNVMKEVDKGQVIPDSKTRELPIDGKGLEAEIRCHQGHKTEMKFGKVAEITPPAQ